MTCRFDTPFIFQSPLAGRKPVPCAVATLALTLLAPTCTPNAWAASVADIPTLPTVTVQSAPARDTQASISGWGNSPSWQAPVQAIRLQAEALEQAQVQRLADLVKLDASTSDAYNTTGYWDYLSIRGFTLDNASNYRREGLPISAETRIGLDNKSAVEIFKGTSGLQAGVSAPGGLINLLVKRPEGQIREAELALTGGSSVKAAVDLSERFGAHEQFGLRVNAAIEKLSPDVQATQGHRRLTAVAGDWQVSPDTQLDIELEHSVHRQPSVPGFSAFGGVLPSAKQIDPAINLNQQAWSLPVDMRGHTGSIRWQQRWHDGWQSVLTYGEQRLLTNDRAAFPYGCDSEGVYDRFCSDGSMDIYDFRSDNERRVTRALQAQLTRQWQLGNQVHDVSFGLMRSHHQTDVSRGPYNYATPVADSVSVSNPTAPLMANDAPLYDNADRYERSTEWSLQDAITFNPQWRAWLGLRHTRLSRTSISTDGITLPTTRQQNITTPSLAIGYTLAEQTQAYASWGKGAEVLTAPGFGGGNSGEVMPAVKSEQVEIGIKQAHPSQQWGMNVFHIKRPELDVVASNYTLDGYSTHQGLEGYWHWRTGAWGVHASAMLLHARRGGSVNGLNGKTPTNVPRHTLKWSGSYQLPATWTSAMPTTTFVDIVHEGPRWADKANTLRVSAWTRVDASVQTVQKLGDQAVTWRLGVTNLLNTRAWRESPNNFDHIWLFPMAARTWTTSAQINF